MLGHAGTSSAPASPAVNGVGGVATTTTTTASGMVRPKPKTGTGMVYRTSSYGVGGSKTRAPMILSFGYSTNASLVSSGGGDVGNRGGRSIVGGSTNGFSRGYRTLIFFPPPYVSNTNKPTSVILFFTPIIILFIQSLLNPKITRALFFAFTPNQT